jgi:malate dehydrogenase
MRSAAQLLRRRSYSSASGQPERKVAILGAAGGIGQPLALLMKLNPLVSSLSLYDIAATPGVAADVSHINSPALVSPPAPSSSPRRLSSVRSNNTHGGLVFLR